MAETRTALPQPVKTDSRTCFGIDFFTSEEDAQAYAAAVKGTYNGGFNHGMPTGRDKHWDHVDAVHGPLFAVTTP